MMSDSPFFVMPIPKPPYTVEPTNFTLSHFLTGFDDFVQHKESVKKLRSFDAQSYLMCVFCQHYTSRLVLREKRGELGTVMEVLDGWLRIDTLIRFLKNQIPLPIEIRKLFPDAFDEWVENDATYYHKLNRSLNFSAFVATAPVIHVDIIKGIDEPHLSRHEEIAKWLFETLQNR